MKKTLILFVLIIMSSVLYGFDVYIVNSNDETLSHYNTETQVLTNDVLQLEEYANQIVVQDSLAYVVNSGVNAIQVINLKTISTIDNIQCPNGSNPYEMVLHPGGTKGYVTGLYTNAVYVIDLTSNSVTNTISVGTSPEGLVFYNDLLYVMNTCYGSDNGTVSVINTNTYAVVDEITVGNNPQYGAIDASGRLHVVCTGNYGYGSPAVWGKIYVVNTSDYNDISVIDVGSSPTKIGIHPDGTAYLADGNGLGYMSYNASDFTIIHSSSDLWAIGGSLIRFDENGNIYLGDSKNWINNGDVYIYSQEEELLHTLTVGVNPQDVGFKYPGMSIDPPHSEAIIASNYPNPFSNSTKISFSLSMDLHELSQIEIYNVKGQMIEQLGIKNSDLEISYNASSNSSSYQVTWNGTDKQDNKVPSGVYLYKIISDNVQTSFHKMIYLR